MTFYANSYGEAPGETFRRRIYCGGSEASLSECSISGGEQNCDPRYTLGVSCNTSKLHNMLLVNQNIGKLVSSLHQLNNKQTKAPINIVTSGQLMHISQSTTTSSREQQTLEGV